VRRELSVEHVGDGGDTTHFGDSAGVREVGLHDGDTSVEWAEELVARVEALAGGDRD
jgi:hypothetical protein